VEHGRKKREPRKGEEVQVVNKMKIDRKRTDHQKKGIPGENPRAPWVQKKSEKEGLNFGKVYKPLSNEIGNANGSVSVQGGFWPNYIYLIDGEKGIKRQGFCTKQGTSALNRTEPFSFQGDDGERPGWEIGRDVFSDSSLRNHRGDAE